jgi:hypothetical protein
LNGKTYFGLDLNSFHQIEIFIDGNKKQKFSYFDLNPEKILFPIYSTELFFEKTPQNKIILKSKEKGNVSCFFMIMANNK